MPSYLWIILIFLCLVNAIFAIIQYTKYVKTENTLNKIIDESQRLIAIVQRLINKPEIHEAKTVVVSYESVTQAEPREDE